MVNELFSISVLNRTGVIEPNLGSPISSLPEINRTVDYGPPIEPDESIINHSLPDNSNTKLRGNVFSNS